jgi:hypothetical protein
MFGFALDFFSLMVPHIPPKGKQRVRYAGLYALGRAKHTGSEYKMAVIANTALEALRAQIPQFVLDPLLKVVIPHKW